MSDTQDRAAPGDELDLARRTIKGQIEALEAVAGTTLDASFVEAVDLLARVRGHIVITGVGKSGLIGAKIASTLASLGAPAFFLHATEASHGDLGMITPDNAVIAISNSGESRELHDLLVYCNRTGVKVVGITRAIDSRLGMSSDVVIRLPKVKEVSGQGLAPMASTTATLAIGDALAAVLAERRRFTAEDFGLRHPGGLLGLRLQTVDEWLTATGGRRTGADLPLVKPEADARAVIAAVTAGLSGCAGVIDEDGALCGQITDGDIRRALNRSAMEWTAGDIMTMDPVVVLSQARMREVIEIFTDRRISNAFAVDENHKPLAVVHIKDLMEQGFV
ncbi:MAG: KpsF/GutQ family sugar-phosphate isomerase [Pseudomonadota bacterium]